MSREWYMTWGVADARGGAHSFGALRPGSAHTLTMDCYGLDVLGSRLPAALRVSRLQGFRRARHGAVPSLRRR